jgi:hypothetical protein
VGSAVAIGLFYILCSYAWVFGAGFDRFVEQATGADPWRNLGEVFWGTGWILIFLAICNSIAANSNAAVNAATRVFYALARNGLAPRSLGHTHPEYKTPHVAIIWMSGFALVLALVIGAIWDPLTGFGMIATAAVPVVILVYMLVSAGCIAHYAIARRGRFNPLLHLVLPVGGIVLFFFPLYYQFYKAPPDYPVKGANWVALAWTVIGIVLTVWVVRRRPDRLADIERVYVEDEPRLVDEAYAAVEARRRVDVEHADGSVAVVAERVLDAGRREDERPRRRGHLVVAEDERHLALEDVERVVLVLVDVRLEHAARGDLDDPEREAGRVCGAGEELDVADAVTLPGRDDNRIGVHGRILTAARRSRRTPRWRRARAGEP